MLEINALVYDEAIAIECRMLFELNQEGSFEMTPELCDQHCTWTKVHGAV